MGLILSSSCFAKDRRGPTTTGDHGNLRYQDVLQMRGRRRRRRRYLQPRGRPEARKGSPVRRLSTLLVGAVAVVPFLGQQRAVPESPTRRLLGRKGVGCGGLGEKPGEGRLLARERSRRRAKPVRLCPCSSDVNLFSYGEGIIDFNAEIPDSALDLRMP